MNNLVVCVQNEDQKVTAKQTIDAIYKAGFKNVFVQYYHRETKGLDELQQIDYCRKLGLNIVFGHLGYKNSRDINSIWLEGEKGEKVIDGFIEDFKVLKERQIELVVMHLVSGKEPPIHNEIGLNRIKRLVKHAKEIGIKIALENTRQRIYVEYILENIKDENLGLCFDAGHYHCFSKDEFNYSLFKNRIFVIHLHDNDKIGDWHLLPFDGNIDWNNVLTKLKENNYNGPITLEVCYRYDYLNQSVDDFYKEAYERGRKLEEINKLIDIN